ncbi:auxin efflux carrier [Laetiporus sulphureus 93-53]|uniref:Auxin efflux carrier n=1 Tax=Laetiporus sulphureus 93-53 TaxID=1314785 RepID=A0A165E8I4_9APHY|nr:auxin efflux carrier [Laetiporus sulphureus 93-53]KZT06462.1 auxin efflux carrier [Laetiporus sulphureus 93-53]
MPLLKTYIAIAVGYFLARRGLFSADASKGASQVSMNISLPALIFANVVPAFTSSNISALGPLFLTAFSYLGIGFSFGLIIREVFYVPRNFWQGIVVLCGMSNWGNLPNAIVSSIMTESPFNPSTDPELGVSYVAIFIVSYHLVFWVAGAARSLAWDYLPGVPQGAEAERHYSWKEKPIGGLIARYILRIPAPPRASFSDLEKVNIESSVEKGELKLTKSETDDARDVERQLDDIAYDNDPDIQLARRTSRLSATTYRSRQPSAFRGVLSSPIPPAPPSSPAPESIETVTSDIPPPPFLQRLKKTLRPLSAAITPITCSLAISLPIALIPDLKALFTPVKGGPSWKGPDGEPPLYFIMQTAEFLGTMAVPLSLIILGASFARLKVPRPFSRLPIMAMIAATVAKMVVLPVIGVFMVQAMVKGGLIAKEALAERFVAMFLSGTPAAVNQFIVSNLYSTTGDVDTLSAFLLVQYMGMFFCSAALTAVSLLLL